MNKYSRKFLLLSLLLLISGVFIGFIGGLQYLFPTWLKESFPFTKVRPLHVYLVIAWIFTAATGGIYHYLPGITGKPLFSQKLVAVHWLLLVFTTFLIIYSYATGHFGGREYLEFPPIIGVPLLLYWTIFMFNFFMSVRKNLGSAPIYLWMWCTGLLFFFLTFVESYLWLLPWFRDNLIRDITVQWKALGSMVGSWNMLVYGTGFYVMEQISGNTKVTRSPQTFFFYFLGLTNLMFNWGHHIYNVPNASWIRNIAYIISMTELLIVGNIIYQWRKTLADATKNFHRIPYRFLSAADGWVFLNLCLAILISIPAINLYTHGTHITVAHAMGATIGINTMILFASLYFMAEQKNHALTKQYSKLTVTGFWVSNIGLLVFWISLIGSGIAKAMEKENGSTFQQIMINLSPWFHAFAFSGIILLAGISCIAGVLFAAFLKR